MNNIEAFHLYIDHRCECIQCENAEEPEGLCETGSELWEQFQAAQMAADPACVQ